MPVPCFKVSGQTVENTSNTSQTVTVITASYSDNILTDIKTEKVTFAAIEKKSFALPVNGRIFVWNSLDGMMPMTK